MGIAEGYKVNGKPSKANVDLVDLNKSFNNQRKNP